MKSLTVIVAALGLVVMMMGLAAWRGQPEGKAMAGKASNSGSGHSKSGFSVAPLTKSQIDKLAQKLTPEEAKVILKKGTEAAFCGNLTDNKKDGAYVCRLCGLPLFRSDTKFQSGTGWPSFFAPFDRAHIAFITDDSHGMRRTEIRCARCDAHLGHVFPDGPKPTGLRYCMNGHALKLEKKE